MSKSLKVKIGIGLAILATTVGGYILVNSNKKLVEEKKIEMAVAKAEQERQIEEKKRAEQEEQIEEKKRAEEEKKLEEQKVAKEKAEAEKKAKEEKKEEVKVEVKDTDKEDNKGTTKKPSNTEKPKEESKVTKTLADKVSATKTATRTNQIITVIGGKVTLWNKNNGKFVESIKTSGRVGYGGMTSASNKREGDGKTPTGVYPILYAFGTGANPGTSFNYRQITQNSYFVDDVNSKYYNQWYEGTDQKGEHMIKYKTQYKYGLVIGYNRSNTPGKGSAIFLHCNGSGNTAGCVSIPTGEMLSMMKKVKPGAEIIITTSEENLKNY